MELSIDEGRGQEVGSHIRMSGRIWGVGLFLDEVVTVREPPVRKVWETVGPVHLLVVGHYRMAVELSEQGNGSCLRVAIDYDLPAKKAWLGRIFGRMYAKWCVTQMTRQVVNRFGTLSVGADGARGATA